MLPQESSLALLAAAVADGADVDWDQAESSAADPAERLAITQLRSLAAASVAMRPQTWGPLELREEIGRGSFGTVYRAWDTRLERHVALKLLREQTQVRRYGTAILDEGRMLARLRHPNVVTVFGADQHDDSVGLWMELVPGQTLKDIVEQQGPFGAHEAALVGRDLCRALAAVHQRGFVHRDVKAQNAMREAGGRIVLMDFGAGDTIRQAVDDAGVLAGTPAYLAPEVLRGEPHTVQSDLYSLGVLLYYLVSRQFPVVGSSLADLRDSHAAGRRRGLRDARADLPAAFVSAIDRATSPVVTQRPATAGEFEHWLAEALDVPASAATAGIPAPRPSMAAAAGRFWWVAALLVVTLVAVIVPVSWRSTPSSRPMSRDSVAIVPFAAGDSGNDYLSSGITQDVVAHLASLPGLRIISGASTLPYRSKATPAADIGRSLGVATVLDGTVQQVGDRVRVSVRLSDAASGEQLWADTFDRRAEELFAMQTEVSRRIALALRGELSRAEVERFQPSSGPAHAVFDLYLKGKYNAGLRTEDGLNRAVALFNDAIVAAPEFAPAYAGLAEAYISLGVYGVVPRSAAYARATEAADRAIALDPSLAEAHAARGYAHKNRFEWVEAEEGLTRAIALRPGYATAHHWYSIFLTQRGRFPEALTEIKAAIALDPLSIGANLQLAGVLLMAHRFEDAIAQWQRTIQMDPEFLNPYRGIATAYAYMGLHERAQRAIDDAAAHTNPTVEDQEFKADRAYVLALAGRKQEARRIVNDLIGRTEGTGEQLAGSIAAILTGLGDKEAALSWLAKATAARDPEVGYLAVDPRWDPLRGDPRFKTLLAGLGF